MDSINQPDKQSRQPDEQSTQADMQSRQPDEQSTQADMQSRQPDEDELRDMEAAVESILFASGEPVHIERFCTALSVERPDAERILHRLRDYYAYERRGMRLLQLEDNWQLCSSPDHADVIRKAFEIRKPAKLSQPALEALTIIAYYQPTTRAYVDKLRGVDSAYTVRLLEERGLIEECGRLQAPGRPVLYRTTEQFLRAFHLSTLEELPPLPEGGGLGAMPPGIAVPSAPNTETPPQKSTPSAPPQESTQDKPSTEAATPETPPQEAPSESATPPQESTQDKSAPPQTEAVREQIPESAVPDESESVVPDESESVVPDESESVIPDEAENMPPESVIPDKESVMPDETDNAEESDGIPEEPPLWYPREIMPQQHIKRRRPDPKKIKRRKERARRKNSAVRKRRFRTGPRRRIKTESEEDISDGASGCPDHSDNASGCPGSGTDSGGIKHHTDRHRHAWRTAGRCIRCLLYGCWVSWPFWWC